MGPDKHVIFLKDIRAAHLELLLQYMYQGEIKVQEAELVTVLNVAQSLEIKGLTDNSESKQQQGGKRTELHLQDQRSLRQFLQAKCQEPGLSSIDLYKNCKVIYIIHLKNK